MLTMDSEAVAVADPTAAEMVEIPSDIPVVRPVAASTVATDGVLDTQVARLVTLAVVASV